MRHDGDRARVVGQLAQELHHLRLEPGIEARGGLVEEQQAGPAQELGRDPDPLPLPARKRADAGIGMRLEPRSSSARSTAASISSSPVSAGSRSAPSSASDSLHAQVRVDDLVLGQVADVGEPALTGSPFRRPILGRSRDSRERLSKRGLAGARSRR